MGKLEFCITADDEHELAEVHTTLPIATQKRGAVLSVATELAASGAPIIACQIISDPVVAAWRGLSTGPDWWDLLEASGVPVEEIREEIRDAKAPRGWVEASRADLDDDLVVVLSPRGWGIGWAVGADGTETLNPSRHVQADVDWAVASGPTQAWEQQWSGSRTPRQSALPNPCSMGCLSAHDKSWVSE